MKDAATAAFFIRACGEVPGHWTQLFNGPLLVQQMQPTQERCEDAGLFVA